MDQNELLNKIPYPLLYKHRWFFLPVLKAPAWQRYALTTLLIGWLISCWWIYWYLPLMERHQQAHQAIIMRSSAPDDARDYQHLLQQYRTTYSCSITTPSFITWLLPASEEHGLTVIEYAPQRVTPTTGPSQQDTRIAIQLSAATYAQVLTFIHALIKQYPTAQIPDMLIAKRENSLFIQLDVVVRHEALLSSCSTTFSHRQHRS